MLEIKKFSNRGRYVSPSDKEIYCRVSWKSRSRFIRMSGKPMIKLNGRMPVPRMEDNTQKD